MIIPLNDNLNSLFMILDYVRIRPYTDESQNITVKEIKNDTIVDAGVLAATIGCSPSNKAVYLCVTDESYNAQETVYGLWKNVKLVMKTEYKDENGELIDPLKFQVFINGKKWVGHDFIDHSIVLYCKEKSDCDDDG